MSSVLIFPPLTSSLRHLTHKYIDNFYCPNLCSFSIGQENQRRIVIGLTDKLVRCSLPYKCIHEKIYCTCKDIVKISQCICSQRINLLLAENLDFSAFMSTYEKKKVIKNDTVDKRMSDMKEKSTPLRYRHKKPDKQLYVPRALRKTDVENEVEKNEARTTKACGQQMSCEIPKIKKKESTPALSKQLHNNKDTSNVKVTKIDDSDIHKILNVDNALSLESGNNSVVKRTKACVSGENLNDHEQCMKVFNPRHTEIESESNENNSNSKAACMTTNEVCNEENLCKTKIEDEPSSENPEDSWETMFNDEGDCLDPKFIKELCYITGEIDLTVVKNDYSNYQPLSRNSTEEFENIVELYGFPVEFKTHDLISAFSSFQETSYLIKWVDDCHALAIFSSPAIANQALHLTHPFIKVRPVSEGIKESKEKARFCARIEAPKPRPVTSAVLARRLVSGALGLKVNASKEQRDIERNMLKEAKEKKKLKARQRQDIWNGIVT